MRLTIAKTPVTLIPFIGLCSCTFSPNILSAVAIDHSRTEIELHVAVSNGDAIRLKNGQFYFSVVTVECKDGSGRFPAEAFVNGKRAAEFDFNTSSNSAAITAVVPKRIFDEYHNPCVYLEGGSYFSGKIRTALVRVVRQNDSRDTSAPQLNVPSS